MKNFLSKILVFSFILVSIFYLLSSATFAQATSQTTPAQSAQYIPPNTNSDVPNNLHNWTQSAMIEVMSALSCQLSGIDPTNPNQQCLGVDQKTGKIGFVPNGGGAIGVMDKLITMTFTMPIHTGDYVSYLSQNFGITKQAYAQGVGFKQLSPFLSIWVAFRNLVYLLFIIVFVVIGMFIMLRVQFDPRTVFTVQNQIPKLIIGIILVTFSFAIAGLMIDAMYIVIYFVYGVTLTIPGAGASLGNINLSTLQGQSAIGVFGGNIGSIASSVSGSVSGVFGSIVDNALGRLLTALVLQLFGILGGDTLIASVLGGTIAVISGGAGIPLATAVAAGAGGIIKVILPFLGVLAAPQLAGAVGGFITYIIIIIALLFALFRLWFELIKAYTFILFDIVLAPFWIISSLTPGNPAGFSLWLRAVLSNLAVFPTTIVMFLLGQLFINAFKNTAIQPGDLFIPPLIGNAATPDVIGAIIGLTVIFTTPAVIGMVKNAFKAPNFPLTTAGKMFGTGPSLVTGAYNTAMQGLNMRYQWGILHPKPLEQATSKAVVPGPASGGGKQA